MSVSKSYSLRYLLSVDSKTAIQQQKSARMYGSVQRATFSRVRTRQFRSPVLTGTECLYRMASEDANKRSRPDVTLFSYWRSSCSYRVRIALELKGIPFAYEAVHLLKNGGAQLSEEYQKVNPMKEVPSLVIDDTTLTQSTAIIEYLEETRPQPALLPADAKARAQVRAVCSIISNDIQPVGNLRVQKHVASIVEDPSKKDSTKEAWAKHYITAGFTGLEALLAGTADKPGSAGKYCVGDAVTMADIFLVPQVYNAQRFKVDMTAFPTIARVNAALVELPAFKAAHPAAQPDAEA